MRKYDVAYVPNGTKNYYPVKDLQDMSLEEIKEKYIKICAKALGNVSVCSKCKTPCEYGKRAIQLLANSVYNDPPIPLYGGKTLIDWAKAENERRRRFGDKKEEENAEMTEEKVEEKTEEVKPEEKKQKKDDWYEESLKAEDQYQWVADHFGIPKAQAKKKVYSYRYRNGLTDQNYSSSGTNKKRVAKEKTEKIMDGRIETKLEQLMQLQDQQKELMDKYMKLYEEAKAKYEDIKAKTDVLCSAFDIINEA